MTRVAAARERLSAVTPHRDSALAELLVCRVEDYCFALPTSSVERILRMAAINPVVDAPQGVIGMLDLQGTGLPVVDPRRHLGLAACHSRVDQRLVVVQAESRFVIWVDEVHRIVSLPMHDLDVLDAGTDRPLVPYVARIDGAVIWVLSPAALDPGQLEDVAA